MFTGIITDIGKVVRIDLYKNKGGDTKFWIETGLDLTREEIGASISCSGACMTVIEKTDSVFCVSVSEESLDKTTLKSWRVGSLVNLEPALRVGDALGGHYVTGHVDAAIKILDVQPVGGSHFLKCELPPQLSAFVAPKGSVTLDGVSLTVNEAGDDYFTVNLIPHTWDHTSLQQSKTGGLLNCEIDLIARYLARQRKVSHDQ